MFNNTLADLEELIGPRDVERIIDNRPEDYHRDGGRAAGSEYKQSRVDSLLWAYRDVGYLYADLNPLGGSYSERFTRLREAREAGYHRLTLEEFGLSDADLDAEFFAGGGMRRTMRLRDIIAAFREIYCGFAGIEFLHIQDRRVREWLLDRLENPSRPRNLPPERRRIVLEDLVKAEELEKFLQRTFIGQRRFSIEGAEAVIPALHALADGAHAAGVEHIVIGASHRGRLTILNRILEQPPEEIFNLFEPDFTPGLPGGSGDVKYHVGYSGTHTLADGSSVAITLAPNASHVESVDGVVEGEARALQDALPGRNRSRVLPVLLHGEAAFSAQGVASEVLNLSRLEGYTTGGTVHIVVNNQVGFTTPPRSEHSTLNPTDVAKAGPVPVFHVNADRPEEVVRLVELALDYRQTFGSDVVVDVVCYRRHGHNEGDEPSYTHPYMYRLIRGHESVASQYLAELVAGNVTTGDEVERMKREYVDSLGRALSRERERGNGKKTDPAPARGTDAPAGPIEPIAPIEPFASINTAVSESLLDEIVARLSEVPEGFTIHEKLGAIVRGKRKIYDEKRTLDWGLAETVAFGSLLIEGVPVRLSGEDSARGTFSQRHLVWWNTGPDGPSYYAPLDHLRPGQRAVDLYDSPLSEYSIMAFEYGYASAVGRGLVMWEAQFGDFSNGAQVVIDNYVAGGEAKWGSRVPLVLLLPHGYDGQGPDHSTAHLERFLALCAEDNMRVCQPTLPAQYFHLLRAQALDHVRKPLVVMTPKSLLRHELAVSRRADFSTGRFRPVLDDPAGERNAATVFLCTGKIFFELWKRREDGKRPVAIVRLERLYPFPGPELADILKSYPRASRFVWVQEEPANRGAWSFVRNEFERVFPGRVLEYVGRKASASSAAGSHREHAREEERLLADAFALLEEKSS